MCSSEKWDLNQEKKKETGPLVASIQLVVNLKDPSCLQAPSYHRVQFSSWIFQKVCWCGFGAESFPLSPASVLVSAGQGPAGPAGGGIHLVRPGERKSIFLERKAKKKEWFPPGQERPQFHLKPYRALHFPAPPLSASGLVL